jgi:hypothetical protein
LHDPPLSIEPARVSADKGSPAPGIQPERDLTSSKHEGFLQVAAAASRQLRHFAGAIGVKRTAEGFDVRDGKTKSADFGVILDIMQKS